MNGAASDRLHTRTLTVAAQKGGVHKTTLAVHVATRWAQQRSTVLVDTDPQGDATLWLTAGQPPARGLADVLRSRCSATQALHEVGDNLWLLGASEELETLGLGLHQLAQLRQHLAALPVEAAVIDTPPGMGTLMLAALAAAAQVLVPVQPAVLSLAGAQGMLENVVRLSAQDGWERQAWLVLTGLDRRTRLAHDMTRRLERLFPRQLLATRIPRQQLVENAVEEARTLYQFAPRARVTAALAALADELWREEV